MSDYVDGLSKSNFVPNIVILFAGEYFAIRQPDSGLAIKPEYVGLVKRVQISPTRIDPLRPSNTISSSSFSLLDEKNEVSKLFLNQNGFRLGQAVKVFIGRSFENLDFSEYFELPDFELKGFNKIDNGYSFKANEKKDRLNNGSFSIQTKLAVDIFAATTVITVQDVSNLPTSGFAKIKDEFFSWSGITGSNLTGVIRGEFGSIPADHKAGENIFKVENITSRNVIDLLLQILISSGGGGVYDVLSEGAGFDESLIDVQDFLDAKDAFFTGASFEIKIYNQPSLQRFLENEIFLPYGLRLRSNRNGKIGLALLNRNIFEIDSPIINEDNSLDVPDFNIDENRISNRVRIFWNFSDGQNEFLNVNEYTDAESITEYGETSWQVYQFKGIKDLPTINAIAALYLERFRLPRPTIQVSTNNSTSFLNIGDKTELFSTRLPTEQGNLNFISTLEVLNQAYNVATGTVKYELAFTSFSGLRQCFIAPSDTIITFSSQKSMTIASGRGVHYRTGWIMKLYSNNTRDFYGTQTNEIVSIVGDVITFKDDWLYPLDILVSRIMFADYNEVSEQQKKFCFINVENENFSDGTKPYQVTFA